jgi:hypothetical protein
LWIALGNSDHSIDVIDANTDTEHLLNAARSGRRYSGIETTVVAIELKTVKVAVGIYQHFLTSERKQAEASASTCLKKSYIV